MSLREWCPSTSLRYFVRRRDFAVLNAGGDQMKVCLGFFSLSLLNRSDRGLKGQKQSALFRIGLEPKPFVKALGIIVERRDNHCRHADHLADLGKATNYVSHYSRAKASVLRIFSDSQIHELKAGKFEALAKPKGIYVRQGSGVFRDSREGIEAHDPIAFIIMANTGHKMLIGGVIRKCAFAKPFVDLAVPAEEFMARCITAQRPKPQRQLLDLRLAALVVTDRLTNGVLQLGIHASSLERSFPCRESHRGALA